MLRPLEDLFWVKEGGREGGREGGNQKMMTLYFFFYIHNKKIK